MKKFLSLIFLIFFMITPSFAQNYTTFFVNQSKNWFIQGIPKRDKLNPICRASYFWNDGSEFNLIVDLSDGELYILFINNAWQINDNINNIYNFRINAHTGNTIKGFNAEYELLSKNTIRIRDINVKFMDVFAESNELRFIMPGNILNAVISLDGSREAVNQINNCIRLYKQNNIIK